MSLTTSRFSLSRCFPNERTVWRQDRAVGLVRSFFQMGEYQAAIF